MVVQQPWALELMLALLVEQVLCLLKPAQCVRDRVQQGSGTTQQQMLAGCCLMWQRAGADCNSDSRT